MSDVANLYIKVDSTGVVTATKNLNDLTGTGKKTQGATDSLSKSVMGLVAAYASFETVKKLVVECFEAFNEAEAASTRLQSSVNAMGNAGRINVSSLKQFASTLQQTSIYEADATVSAMAMMEQLTGLSERGLKQAIPRVQDFASAMGVDLGTAAELVSKAINGQTGALSRYGIQIEKVKDPAQQFDNVMVAMDEHFKGMSDAVAQTTAGQLIVLKNQWKELKEEIGGVIAELLNPALTLTNKTIDVQKALGTDPATINDIATLEAGVKTLRTTLKGFQDEWGNNRSGLRGDIEAEYNEKIASYQRQILKVGYKTDYSSKGQSPVTKPAEEMQVGNSDSNTAGQNMANRYTAYAQDYLDQKMQQSMGNFNDNWAARGMDEYNKLCDAQDKFEESTDDMTDRWVALGAAMQDEAEKAAKAKKQTEELTDAFSDLGLSLAQEALQDSIAMFQSLGEALQQGTLGADSFGEAMGQMAMQLLNALPTLLLSAGLQLLIKDPDQWPVALALIGASGLTAIASGYVNSYYNGTSSAHGNVFDCGSLVPYAAGGVVSSPTFFTMSNGGTGLMGEAGPEGVLPLKRLANGNLGVQANGGGSGGTSVVVNNYTGEKVKTKEGKNAGGQREIEIMVGSIVKKQFTSGAFDKTMSANYGVSRRGQRL